MIGKISTLSTPRKVSWVLIVVFAILIGLYPGIYFFIDRKFGLLSSKPAALLVDSVWNIAFYTHIVLGGLALLIGWTQFNENFRNRNLVWHRRVGITYLISVVLSAVAGIYIGFFATGGLPAAAGFISLGLVWLTTTTIAYLSIKQGLVARHQKMMIYSYAATFAAVTLRIWLPLLVLAFGDFVTAYVIVAWLCWVPNIVVAASICGRIRGSQK